MAGKTINRSDLVKYIATDMEVQLKNPTSKEVREALQNESHPLHGWWTHVLWRCTQEQPQKG
jgi:hypothetical protein